jgi:hypothetical protein
MSTFDASKLVDLAKRGRSKRDAESAPAFGVSLEDFHAYMPRHSYIYTPSREMWPAASVNARIPPIPEIGLDNAPVLDDRGKPKQTAAATWLDRNKPIEQMTWAPGEPMLIRDRLISDGGGCSTRG